MVRYNHGLACIPGTARLSSRCFRGKHRVLGAGGPRYDVAGSDHLTHVCMYINTVLLRALPQSEAVGIISITILLTRWC